MIITLTPDDLFRVFKELKEFQFPDHVGELSYCSNGIVLTYELKKEVVKDE